MHEFDPYLARPIRFLELATLNGWRIKIYGISTEAKPLPREVVALGTTNVLSQLPQPSLSDNRYGVGFLIIHHGTLRNWYLLDWWEKGDILHHKLFSSPLDEPSAISEEPDKSLMACVHELRVIAFESEAWIKTVLCHRDVQSVDNYLQLRFE
jgi:hypothetical protein